MNLGFGEPRAGFGVPRSALGVAPSPGPHPNGMPALEWGKWCSWVQEM